MAVLVCSAILLHLALTLAQTPPFEFASDKEPNNRRQEEPSFSCTAGPDGTECLRQSRVLLLEQEGKRSWSDAHRLCRERDMFLVPSEETLSLVQKSGLVAQLPSPVIDIWAGARSLHRRPRLFQWLLPRGNRTFDFVGVDGMVKTRLCLAVTVTRGDGLRNSRNWRPCDSLQHVLCVSDPTTQDATQAADYRPVLTVSGIPAAAPLRNASSSDAALGEAVAPPETRLVLSTHGLSHSDLSTLTLQCGPGDSVVRDGNIIAIHTFTASQVNETRALDWEVLVGREGPGALSWGDGAYWCQRYVRGAVAPAQSGRLLITTSGDSLLLSAPPAQAVARFVKLFGNETAATEENFFDEYDYEGSGQAQPEQTDEEFFSEIADQLLGDQLRAALNRFNLRDKLGYLAIASEGQDYNSSVISNVDTNATIIFNLNSELSSSSRRSVLSVFHCPEMRIGGGVWRQPNPEINTPVTTFSPVTSQTPCYSEDGLVLLRRSCVPSFTRGARWGGACSSGGHCQDGETQQCRPKGCPTGYLLLDVRRARRNGSAPTPDTGLDSDVSAEADSDSGTQQLCLIRLDGVTFENQSDACQSRGGQLWVPHADQVPQLRSSVLGRYSLWLPTRRLWPHGPLWPLSTIAEREIATLGNNSLELDSTLECLVQRSDGVLRSVACSAADHSALCVTAAHNLPSLPGVVHHPARRPYIFVQQGRVFLNVTDVLDLVRRRNGKPAEGTPDIDVDRIECFKSTSDSSKGGYVVRSATSRRRFTEQDSVSEISSSTRSQQPIVFTTLSLRERFGYVVCAISAGASAPYQRIVSNRLDLGDLISGETAEEFLVGFPSSQEWDSRACEATFCLGRCPCFSRSLDNSYRVDNATGQLYSVSLQALRATKWKSEDRGGREFYVATIDLAPPQRRRRRQVQPQKLDATRILREAFGSEMVSARPARCCPAETTDSPPLSWPRTCRTAEVAPVQLCVDQQGRPARRRCLSDPIDGARWAEPQFPASSCAAVSDTSRSLHRLAARSIDNANRPSAASELKALSQEPSLFTQQDVLSVASTLEHIGQAVPYPPLPGDEQDSVRQDVLAVVSQLMDADSAVVSEATSTFSAGPRAVRALEDTLRSVTGTAATATLNTANVVAISGKGYVGITVNGSSRPLVEGDGILPLLGQEAGLTLLLANRRLTRATTFLSMRDGTLLQSPGQRVTSRVISALTTHRSEETLDTTVLFAFRSLPGPADSPVCAYWDFSLAIWSTRGCYLKSVRSGSDICICNHLTNFARIINFEPDVRSITDRGHRVLDVITYVGCALSLLGLALTIVTFLLFKKWRRLRGNQIMMHLAVALVGVYVSFLVGLAVTNYHAACIGASIALHYCLMAAFGWMAVEAVFQYLRFVRVLGTYIPGFMRKAAVCAWGGALVPVVAVLAVDPGHYPGQRQLCWMSFDSALYAFALPALLVLAFNGCVFGLVVHALTCGRQTGLRTNQSERRLAMTRLRMAVIICVLLGLPWLFGFVAVREARFAFAVIFCLCTSLQGFAIFILMVVGERSARELWNTLMRGQCCAEEQKDGYSTSNTAATTNAAPAAGSSESKALVHKPATQRTPDDKQVNTKL